MIRVALTFYHTGQADLTTERCPLTIGISTHGTSLHGSHRRAPNCITRQFGAKYVQFEAKLGTVYRSAAHLAGSGSDSDKSREKKRCPMCNSNRWKPDAEPVQRLRRGDRRRRVRGAVYAPPPARARALGAGLRGGQRSRRHLVLESLPRRALRYREHGLLLLVLGRTRSRNGSGASATPASRRSCATSITSPTASICAGTSSSRRASPPRIFDEATNAMGRSTPIAASASRRGSASWRRAASPPRRCPTSRASIPSRASGITPATGRTRASISPASGSA